MVSASAPSSLASHADNPSTVAARHRSRYRWRTSASKASSFLYQRSRPASCQNARISAGVAAASPVMIAWDSSRRLLLVAELAAQDFSDIGLRQVGPEFDLL